MEPSYQRLRLVVGKLALRFPSAEGRDNQSTVSPFYCSISLGHLTPRTAPIAVHPSRIEAVGATFYLDGVNSTRAPIYLRISVYAGSPPCTSFWVACGLFKARSRFVGIAEFPVGVENEWEDFEKEGWSALGEGGAQVHVWLRADTESRYVLEFEGDPECNPRVLQVKGELRQPVFTCRFGINSYNHLGDRRSLSQSGPYESSRTWLHDAGSSRTRSLSDRKGWSITIHNVSGNPAARACMVTPFVASPRKNHVARSNPGAWLILRSSSGYNATWQPWGRLEAWREPNGMLGFQFELSNGPVIAESSLSTSKGGRFLINPVTNNGDDFGGFIMSSTVEGEGKCSKPTIEIGTKNVSCMEDAALFVALGAAMDLSMDACRLFSHKLRKELQHQTIA